MGHLNLRTFLLVTVLAISTSIVNASIKVNDVVVSGAPGDYSKLVVKFSGENSIEPEVTVNDRFVQIVLKDAVVWPKIEKKITIGDNKADATLMAYQYDKSTVRIRVMIPYSLDGQEEFSTLKTEKNQLELAFPSKSLADKKTKQVAEYDEGYLEKLLHSKEETDQEAKNEVAKNEVAPMKELVNDQVSVKKAATSKEEIPTFSIGGYVAKFVAFMALVLLLFYGFMTLVKKGVLKKGKLGFLSNMSWVTVLSNTHIGPKRTLMVVKVHNQVFLLGSSESGINLISELKDVPGILKEGEKVINGDNFDTNLVTAETTDREFSIKEDINVAAPEKKARVSFSEQIKSKVKELKPLQ